MARRRVLLIGLVVAAPVAGGLSLWVSATVGRLRTENYPQVRVGMSRAEVEELLGGPPGNYGWFGYAGCSCRATLENYQPPPGSLGRTWRDDAHQFEIYFDDRDHVVGHHERAGYTQSPPEGLVADLWGWARHQLGL